LIRLPSFLNLCTQSRKNSKPDPPIPLKNLQDKILKILIHYFEVSIKLLCYPSCFSESQKVFEDRIIAFTIFQNKFVKKEQFFLQNLFCQS